MTGPEHYEYAEQLLTGADQWDDTDPEQRYYVKVAYAAAQVHATLALAAATALQPSTHSAASPTYKPWRDVAGERS